MKIIDKYLDKYYTKKFIRYIDDFIGYRHLVDRNYVFNDIAVEIQFKPKKYEDKYYQVYRTILYETGLYYLIHINDFEEELKENINEFLKTFR